MSTIFYHFLNRKKWYYILRREFEKKLSSFKPVLKCTKTMSEIYSGCDVYYNFPYNNYSIHTVTNDKLDCSLMINMVTD